jgi:aminoglycoside phosphotransferase (APT) family kinase protein
VWKVKTVTGEFAIRASSGVGQRNRSVRKRLWSVVGTSGVAPKFIGDVRTKVRGFDGWLEVFDWVPGRHLSPSADHVELARTLAVLHTKRIDKSSAIAPRVDLIPFLRTGLKRDLAALDGRNPIDQFLKLQTIAALGTLESRSPRRTRVSLVHNDLVDANVIRSGDGVYLIDWDWAMISQPEVDIFCFLSPFVRSWRTHPRYLSSRVATEFCGTYLRNIGRGRRIDVTAWTSYNALLANWLRRQRLRPPHASELAFYQKAFRSVDRLAQSLATFK